MQLSEMNFCKCAFNASTGKCDFYSKFSDFIIQMNNCINIVSSGCEKFGYVIIWKVKDAIANFQPITIIIQSHWSQHWFKCFRLFGLAVSQHCDTLNIFRFIFISIHLPKLINIFYQQRTQSKNTMRNPMN